jgi:CBS-domain-containing membrane protein
MTENLPDKSSHDVTDQNLSELELSDADILDAMQHIPGYLDISTEDFQLIYHLAHRHALERMFTGVSARRLMRHGIKPLSPDTTLDMAAKLLADSGYKGLPVVDTSQLVIGMLNRNGIF